MIDRLTRGLIALALIVMFGALIWQLERFGLQAARAIRYPDELDYGEGIVWQQTLSLFSGTAYGPIDRFPAIVYHYTPLFHFLTWLLTALTGADMLAMGRLVSILATAAAAIFIGRIAARGVAPGDPRFVQIVAAAGGSFAFFVVHPVSFWAPLMRVDMVAVAFGALGVLLGLKALDRPAWIHASALAFVAAVYARQTSIAPPAALFLLMLWLRPRLAVRGIATAIAAGSIVMLALAVATEGGFIRHIFLYNINRLDLARFAWIGDTLWRHLYLLIAALVPALVRIGAMWWSYRKMPKAPLREKLLQHPGDIAFAAAFLYMLLSGLMALTVLKSGSSLNYFIEWYAAVSVLAGMALITPARAVVRGVADGQLRLNWLAAALSIAPVLLALHAIEFRPFNWGFRIDDRERQRELAILGAQVRAAKKPVISDDMVLLLRNGKPVLWEAAIFAELAHKGVWDEQAFVHRIRRGDFAFFITVGARGQRLFDSRYNPAVVDAIDRVYPKTVIRAGYMVHLPELHDQIL